MVYFGDIWIRVFQIFGVYCRGLGFRVWCQSSEFEGFGRLGLSDRIGVGVWGLGFRVYMVYRIYRVYRVYRVIGFIGFIGFRVYRVYRV